MPCLIAAPSSGSGKTLLSVSLAALARSRGLRLQPFKVGPDYLDPQLLSRVSGLPCRNLDPLLCGERWLQDCFQWHGSRADLALVEGVMGLFDGRGSSSEGSSAAVAALLDLPVVLVVEASRQAGSLAALVRGFRDHGPPPVRLAGVVLNRVGSARHRQLLAEALEAIEVPLLGVLPSEEALEWPSRHLGLLTPDEIPDLPERERAWSTLAERHLDLDQLWPLLAPVQPLARAVDPIATLVASEPARSRLQQPGATSPEPLPIAVARDAAFHFGYPEAEELLRAWGLEPLPWSPLADQSLPPGCRAVLLPGGYPELHAEALAASRRSLTSLRQAAAAGIPIAAECGGLLLLGRSLLDPQGRSHAMAGVLPFSAARGSLSLGYREATAHSDGLLVRRGERLRGHEFHRWQLQDVADSGPLWQLEGWGCPSRSEGWSTATLHASWLHLHWAGCPAIPARIAAAASNAVPVPTSAASFTLANSPRESPLSAGG